MYNTEFLSGIQIISLSRKKKQIDDDVVVIEVTEKPKTKVQRLGDGITPNYSWGFLCFGRRWIRSFVMISIVVVVVLCISHSGIIIHTSGRRRISCIVVVWHINMFEFYYLFYHSWRSGVAVRKSKKVITKHSLIVVGC